MCSVPACTHEHMRVQRKAERHGVLLERWKRRARLRLSRWCQGGRARHSETTGSGLGPCSRSGIGALPQVRSPGVLATGISLCATVFMMTRRGTTDCRCHSALCFAEGRSNVAPKGKRPAPKPTSEKVLVAVACEALGAVNVYDATAEARLKCVQELCRYVHMHVRRGGLQRGRDRCSRAALADCRCISLHCRFGSWTKVSALEVGQATVLVGTTSVLGNDHVKVYGVETGLVQHTLSGHYRGVTCIGTHCEEHPSRPARRCHARKANFRSTNRHSDVHHSIAHSAPCFHPLRYGAGRRGRCPCHYRRRGPPRAGI